MHEQIDQLSSCSGVLTVKGDVGGRGLAAGAAIRSSVPISHSLSWVDISEVAAGEWLS